MRLKVTGMGTTSFEQIDCLVQHLSQHKQAWLAVNRADRVVYLKALIPGILNVAPAWVEAACRAKGLDPRSPQGGEEWLVGPTTLVWYLRRLIKTLSATELPSGQATGAQPEIISVFPDTLADRLMWLGFKGEVWLEPGTSSSQGNGYRNPPETGKVALVLGAGNVSATGILDALHQLFANDAVVILKMNPVNDYLGEFLEAAFEPLRRDGFLQIVYGGAEVGAALCQHALIETVHITGSQQTHDAIVWGGDRLKQQFQKTSQAPLLNKPITSELGCVTPVLVVPGSWSTADLRRQAHHIASMVTHNASFNCVAAKVVVTATGWPQRQQFLEYLHHVLAQISPRPAYYPGAAARYAEFCARYAVQVVGEPGSEVPWTIIPNVPPIAGEYALTEEAWCGVLAEVSLAATQVEDFLAQAVEFANGAIAGSLSCVVLIDPKTQRRHRKAFEAAIAQLRYGAIGINVWTGVMYCLSIFPWGAYPGNSLEDIGSGQGFVHNANLFDHPQKSVLRAPFCIFPRPSWFANHRNLLQLGQRLTAYYAAPSLRRFLAVVVAAIKG
jgi:Aldehyde dehydrogenase family